MYLDDQRPDPGRDLGSDATSGLGRILGPAQGPGAAGPGPGSAPGRSVRPGRGRVVAIISGFAVLGAVIGVSAAEFTQTLEQPRLAGALTSTQPTSLVSATQEESGTPVEPLEADIWDDPTGPATEPGASSPAPSPTPTADYHPIPTFAADEPGLDFGFVTQLTSSDGTISVRFDRASFYTGAEAKKRNNGKAPKGDYLIVNDNPAERSFDLDPNASVMGANRLLNRADVAGREPLTVAEFVLNYQQALVTGSTRLPVWLRHSEGLNGPVTALAEQVLP